MKKQPGWALPNLKDAQVRTTKEAVIEKSLFQIPEQIRLLGQGKKYYLRTYGCQANERDSETLAGILEEMNFTAVEHPEDADLILMNTCAIRKNAEDKVLGEIGSLKRLKRKKPDLLFGLCGCMAQEEDVVAKLLETYRHVNLIFGTHNIHRLPELLYDVMVNGNRSVEVLSKEGDVIENLPVRRFGKHKAWVNIMYGCDKFCTYCIVPYTRGKERSRMMEDILEEVRILKAEGFKEIMERERIAEHTKNDLVSSVAHDLRTPLTSIIGYLGWVRTRTDLDEETRNHYIDIAYQKALRLEQLTNELFGFVKLEHKEMQLHLGKLDLVQLMEQMLDEMTPSFVKNELQVEFLHAEHAIFLEADGELLARLFGNLLNNAVKYGKEGKQIRVSMEKEGEYVVTRVINYGRIIPKQELDHIFQKFYRTEQSRSRDTGGTGLGLAIVQQIAELHHGQVRVKSDLQGTVFEVELPVGMPKGKKEDEKR